MFKIVSKEENKVGVLDTSDDIIEYISVEELLDIVKRGNIYINNILYNLQDCLAYYNDDDVLFDGLNYKLIKESVNSIRVVVKCVDLHLYNHILTIFGSSSVRFSSFGSSRNFTSKVPFNSLSGFSNLSESCIRAREVGNNLYILLNKDFIIEIVYSNDTVDWLRVNFIER